MPSRIEHLLAVLERKQLIHADRSQLGTGDAYRFRHLLIRDAVYDILTKAERARLHERFATWLEERGADSHEPEELVGYHLEQARRYLLELAPLDEEARELGRRAAGHLGPAGRRAFARGDMRAASSLLHRTVDLLPLDSYQRFELLPELGEALMEIGEFERARSCLDDAVAGGAALEDRALEADALLTRLLVVHHSIEDLGGWRMEVQRETDRWIPVLERRCEVRTLAKAWRMVAFFHGTACEWQATADALERGIRCAQEAGDPRQVAHLSSAYIMALSDGPTPAPEAIRRAEETLRLALIDRQAEAAALLCIAPLYAMSGQLIRGRELIARSETILRDLGAAVLAARTSDASARIDLLEGDWEAAEAKLRADYDALTTMGERYIRPVIAALLSKVLYERGHLGEAEALTEIVAGCASPDDIEAQALVRSVRARLLARRGRTGDARHLALETAELTRTTDALVLRADTLVDLAEALASSPLEHVAALEEARALYSLKQHLPGVARADAALAATTEVTDSRQAT